MRIRVKICGFTQEDGLMAAIEAGVDAVGFVFDPSPRQLSLKRAAVLRALIPLDVDTVAVMGRPSLATVLACQAAISPSWIQLMADGLPAVNGASGLRLIPAFEDSSDLLERVDAYCATQTDERPLILADGPRAGSGMVGDWHRVAALRAKNRLILAGGLTPENVGEAIAKVRPYAVDVSSGVERIRGQKDPARIRAFLSAVRTAEAQLGDER
jgi:phosphoribosylanthranilate isomerase